MECRDVLFQGLRHSFLLFRLFRLFRLFGRTPTHPTPCQASCLVAHVKLSPASIDLASQIVPNGLGSEKVSAHGQIVEPTRHSG